MSGLKFTLPDVTSFLPDNLSGLIIFNLKQSHEVRGSEQMQMVFTITKVLEVAIEVARSIYNYACMHTYIYIYILYILTYIEGYLHFLDIYQLFTVKEPLIFLYLVI